MEPSYHVIELFKRTRRWSGIDDNIKLQAFLSKKQKLYCYGIIFWDFSSKWSVWEKDKTYPLLSYKKQFLLSFLLKNQRVFFVKNCALLAEYGSSEFFIQKRIA